MKLSWLRMFQWIGILAALVFAVALRYEAPSEAGMRMNASVENPLSQGMRGYWKLDDGSGTSAVDSSGNGNTLSMTGSPSWTTGNIGPYSLDFSGSGQYLSVASPTSGVLDFGDNTDFSITGWFNRDTFADDHTIVAKRNSSATNTDAGYIVWIDAAADKLNFTVGDGGGTAGDQYTLASTSTFTATGWHQFTAVWDDSLGMQLYIDGRLDNSTTSSTSGIGSLANAVAFRIGAESDADNPFDGRLDDIRIYGYALSADQVKKIYNTTSPTQPVDTSLVGHWTFDGPDIQGTTAIDRSSFGNNGTMTGTTKTIGKLGQALSFNGTSDYIYNPNTNIDIVGKSFSVFYWEKRSSITSDNRFIFSMGTVGSQGLQFMTGFIYTSSPRFICSFYGSSNDVYTNGGDSFTDLEWHYLGCTYDAVTNSMLLYKDAVRLTAVSATATADDYGGNSAISIGARGSSEKFNGSIDDVRVYNRVLSEGEISRLYNLSK